MGISFELILKFIGTLKVFFFEKIVCSTDAFTTFASRLYRTFFTELGEVPEWPKGLVF